MIAAISGSLVSTDAAERVLPERLRGELGEAGRDAGRARIQRWHTTASAAAGPAYSARLVFDKLAAPLASHLGYRALTTSQAADVFRAVLQSPTGALVPMVVTAFGQDLSSAWRHAVTLAISHGARWCFCCSGDRLRVADARRTYSRRHLEIDLAESIADERAFGILWGFLRADAMRPGSGESVLDRAVALSEAHRTAVRESLQCGVRDALAGLAGAFVAAARRRRGPAITAERALDESLIVVYRILFLLFAEARGLVPQWHPVYRQAYTVESLRGPVERDAPPDGLWESLQAIARLAHRGCHAGSLVVTPFNGRLFAPAGAPMAETLSLDDRKVAGALRALTTRRAGAGVEAIAYSDLGVEQLGGVYEQLLDLEPRGGAGTFGRSERRKTTGSFYTPRALTEYVVRRTLAPLVEQRSPEQILALRVLDPAMGSGAFLVAACRYLADAYEQAVLRETGMPSAEIADSDRAAFRRMVAQQCLYGVDLNPMAVQLAKLSLWLATLAADRPLTFLDHNIRVGNSLVGATPEDVRRQPRPGRGGKRRTVDLPLFADASFEMSVGEAVEVRAAIAAEPGDTLEQVRTKEHRLAALEGADAAARRWKRLADVWCAGWFVDSTLRPVLTQSFGSLADGLSGGKTMIRPEMTTALLASCDAVAADRSFFHWQLEFPELFFDEQGQRKADAGFDAVLGNPPWEMLRGDRGPESTRAEAREGAAQLSAFVRGSGVYRLQGEGHANLYQLFLERSLELTRRGGRFGLVLPSGLLTDRGAAALRAALFDRARVDTFACFENRERIFPVHRSLRFALVTAEAGGATRALPARCGLISAGALDALPDAGQDEAAIPLSRAFLRAAGGPTLAVPDIRTRRDLDIVSGVSAAVPALGDPRGWHVSFGRELNATEDRRHFVAGSTGVRVIEGKHVSPFRVAIDASALSVPRRRADTLAGGRRPHLQHRLAYRDVTSPTNRRSLIAAVMPPDVLTTHTLFCLREALPVDVQHFLCGLLNSYVADYLVRMRIGNHVTTDIIERLPVPIVQKDSAAFRSIAGAARALAGTDAVETAARLQADAAHLYGLTRAEFEHVLGTFPLVDAAERKASLDAYAA